MKNAKFNIIICLAIILAFTFMGIINYAVDPYGFFHRKDNIAEIHDKKNLIYLDMKFNKDKNETVVIGASEIGSMFSLFEDKKKFNLIWMNLVNFKEYHEILRNYLKIHPETKKAVIFVNYPGINHIPLFPLPKFNEKFYTSQDLQFLLFSQKTFLSSLDYIKNFLYPQKAETEPKTFEVYPFWLYAMDREIEDIKKTEDAFDKLLELLKEKNIEYKIVVPPYSAIYLALIHDKKILRDNVEAFKRHICNRGCEIYDFSYINKYTSEDILKDSVLFNAPDHPSFLWGIKIYKVFFDKKNAENDLYLLLNKNNIDIQIEKENKLLDEYIKNHQELINLYYKVLSDKNSPDDYMARKTNDIPFSYQKEIEYAENLN